MEEFGEGEAGVCGGEGRVVLDAEHEADQVGEAGDEGDGKGDGDG